MPARIPQEVREQQIAELCEGTIYSFVGWQGEYLRNTSNIICNCSVHGNWVCRLADFINGSRCRKCANDKFSSERRYGVGVWEVRIKNKIKDRNYSLVSMGQNFKGSKSKVEMLCCLHGSFLASVDNIMNDQYGCPKCAKCYRFTAEESKERIIEKIGQRQYSFVRFVKGHGLSEKVILKCVRHGEWSVLIRNFLHSDTDCPGCAKGSFDRNKPGYMYLLLSENGKFVKVGITGKLKERFRELKARTPFRFTPMTVIKFDKGADAVTFEKMIHGSFESAGLTGFQGCTEWLKWNPKIPLWFTFLNG